MMQTYVLQAHCGKEQQACERLRRMGFDAFVPMKTMLLRSGKCWIEKTLPVFSQYIFIRLDYSWTLHRQICRVDGVGKFLGSGKPEAVSPAEEAYIRWLWNDGKPLEVSKVYVSPGGEKLILSGALRKYEGQEIEYHLRQRRAAVWVTIFGRKRKLVLPVIVI